MPPKPRTSQGFRLPRALRLRARGRRRLGGRRMFLIQLAALFSGGSLFAWGRRTPAGVRDASGSPPIRPPTAGDDDALFRSRCIRCGLCGTVCENGCIRYFGLLDSEHGALTPFVDVRRRSCTLCMRCTQICPTGALTPVDDDPEAIAREVRMGVAVVDSDRCISYQGRLCGVCHDACPLPGTAIKLVPRAKPQVLSDGCVGCGRCVETCPQVPTAIDIVRPT